MGTLSLSEARQRVYLILSRVQGGKLAPLDAAGLIGCTERHVRRQVARLSAEGMSVVVHGNTGQVPTHKTSDETLERIRALLDGKSQENVWPTLNVCHLQQKLAEKEGIVIGRSTLDRVLVASGLKRRGRKHAARRGRREPSAAKGTMVQIDGSLHAWFQTRSAKACLMASVDDATGDIVYAHFQKTEDQPGYLRMIHHIATTYGLPLSYYHDKHTILRSPAKPTIEDELAGREPMSQVQRVLKELGVESLAANSPQAKGRVERLFQTLQDRLVKEMAFEKISNCDDANKFLETYLPVHNARFGRAPADPEPAWVPLDGADIFYYCTTSELRSVRQDHTIAWHGKTLQIIGTQYLAGQTIDVRTDYTGEVRLYSQKTRHEYKEVEKTAKIDRSTAEAKKPNEPARQSQKVRPAVWLYGRNKALTAGTVDRIKMTKSLEVRNYELGHNH